MARRGLFYIIAVLMLFVSGYAVYKLFFRSNQTSVSTDKNKKKENEVKANAPMRFSNSLGSSVWSDPRLKLDTGDLGGSLKASAEVENNLKILTALYDQGSDDEFLSKLKDLIAQNPNVKEYTALLGDFHYNEGNWPEAESAVKRLIELDPNNLFAKTSLAEIVAIQGRYDDGQKINEQVLQTDSRNLDAMYGLISISDMKGNPESGVKYLQDLHQKDPGNGNATAVLADSLYARNDTDGAYKMVQEGIKLDGSNPTLLGTGAKIAARQGSYKESAEWSETAAVRATEQNRKVEYWNIAWQARLELNDFDAAERAVGRILELQPKNEMALQAQQTIQAKKSNFGN